MGRLTGRTAAVTGASRGIERWVTGQVLDTGGGLYLGLRGSAMAAGA